MNEKKQSTFNVVAHHLLKQGRRSEGFYLDAKGVKVWESAYIGRLQRRCALGILMPLTKYSKSLEGKDIRSQEVLDAISDQFYKDVEFLHKLQVIHDMRPEKEWGNWLFDFSVKENLVFPQELMRHVTELEYA